jgi:hypothetical protein
MHDEKSAGVNLTTPEYGLSRYFRRSSVGSDSAASAKLRQVTFAISRLGQYRYFHSSVGALVMAISIESPININSFFNVNKARFTLPQNS